MSGRLHLGKVVMWILLYDYRTSHISVPILLVDCECYITLPEAGDALYVYAICTPVHSLRLVASGYWMY